MTIPVVPPHESLTRKTIAISGSSGLIGAALARSLGAQGHEIRPLVRRAAQSPNEISWNPEQETIDAERFAGVDAVIHLAGENIAQRWTREIERRILDSRVKSTSLLARTLASRRSLDQRPSVLLSGSAIGIYGNRGDETLDEQSTLGNDFLADVCKQWEGAASPATDAGIRVVHLRTGLVLAKSGGALAKLLPLFRFGAGGRLGDGRQWMSWIALADYVEAVGFLLWNDSVVGPCNLVASNPVTNEEFTQVLGGVLGRPELLNVPRFALKLAMGDMAVETVLASQRVRPRALLDAGFQFTYSTLESALRAELA